MENHDESEALQQQRKSETFSIGVPEIRINQITTTRPSILNRLWASASSGEKIATTTPKQHLNLAEVFSLLTPKLKRRDRDDISDSNADMIEIEVPLVGSEFARNFNDEQIKNEITVDKRSEEVEEHAEEVPGGYVEISILPSTTAETRTSELTDFQEINSDTTTVKNNFETFPPDLYTTGEKLDRKWIKIEKA